MLEWKGDKIFQKATEKIDPSLVLEVRNLTKIYPLGNFTVKALNNVNLQVKRENSLLLSDPLALERQH